jgi:predicted AAA+ superfamily ATPase
MFALQLNQMEALLESHNRQLKQLEIKFRRHLDIDWNDRLIGLTGARGVGKTTFLLTYIKEQLKNAPHALYASMDDLYFSEVSLVQFADAWVKSGGTHLFLDEIHKYANWSQELKNIYDRYKKLKVVFTGSSVLHIQSGNADLSRRAVVYTMEGLSFREFLNIEAGTKFEKISIEELVKNHLSICKEIISKVKPLAYLDKYLTYGYYPFYLESTTTYHRKLLNTINLTLEVDLPYLRHVDVKYIHKLKKLLYMLSQSVPFQPNVSKLAADIETSRNTVMLYLNYLEEAKLLNLLRSKASSDALLAKPEKVYLHQSNLLHAIGSASLNKENERETFFYNQVNNVCKVEYSPQGDFLVEGKYVFEVGGKTKNKKQIKAVKNSFIAADMLELGFENKIPLWLFGFLY